MNIILQLVKNTDCGASFQNYSICNWEWGPATCVLTTHLGDSDAYSSLRTTGTEQWFADKWREPFSGRTQAQKSRMF